MSETFNKSRMSEFFDVSAGCLSWIGPVFTPPYTGNRPMGPIVPDTEVTVVNRLKLRLDLLGWTRFPVSFLMSGEQQNSFPQWSPECGYSGCGCESVSVLNPDGVTVNVIVVDFRGRESRDCQIHEAVSYELGPRLVSLGVLVFNRPSFLWCLNIASHPVRLLFLLLLLGCQGPHSVIFRQPGGQLLWWW